MNQRAFTWFCIVLILGAVALVAAVKNRWSPPQTEAAVIWRAPADSWPSEIVWSTPDGAELRIKLDGRHWTAARRGPGAPLVREAGMQ